MLITILFFSTGVLGQSGNVAAISVFAVLPFFRSVSLQTLPNFGSIGVSSFFVATISSKYDFLKMTISQVTSKFEFSSLSAILVLVLVAA